MLSPFKSSLLGVTLSHLAVWLWEFHSAAADKRVSDGSSRVDTLSRLAGGKGRKFEAENKARDVNGATPAAASVLDAVGQIKGLATVRNRKLLLQ